MSQLKTVNMVALAPSPLEALPDSATYKHRSSQDLPIYIPSHLLLLGIPYRYMSEHAKVKAGMTWTEEQIDNPV